jgi:predicted RNase H-like HicB family nuclease
LAWATPKAALNAAQRPIWNLESGIRSAANLESAKRHNIIALQKLLQLLNLDPASRLTLMPRGNMIFGNRRPEEDVQMKLNFTIQLWKKPNWYLAKCPELDFVAQGKTREEAEKNLREVMEIQFEEMIDAGTLLDYLEECGFDLKEGVAFPKSEMVGFEKLEMQVH